MTHALPTRRASDLGAPDVGAALRRERSGLALVLGVGDLAGTLPLERVVTELSDFADRALQQALDAAIEERTPGAEPRGFAIIALGKLGRSEGRRVGNAGVSRGGSRGWRDHYKKKT